MAEGLVIPNDLAKMLVQIQTKEPLPPYTTVTHSGKSFALVLPDGAGDHLTLLANAEQSMRGDTVINGLTVCGIAKGRHGQKLTIRVIGGQPVKFVHQSDEAQPALRLICKKTNEVTQVPVGSAIEFSYDEKAPGWRE